jgi:hypothetical protein
VTPANLRALLRDALRLWGATGSVTVADGYVAIVRPEGEFHIAPGPAPTRWFLQTPDRAAAGRPPRPSPSITALLTTLRAALGVARGGAARIGPGAGVLGAAVSGEADMGHARAAEPGAQAGDHGVDLGR